MVPQTRETLHGGNREAAAGIIFFLVTILFAPASVAYGQQNVRREVGFVVNLKGKWIAGPSRQLRPGNPLQEDDIIRARDPEAGDFIEIADLSGRIIKKLTCFEDDCSQPFTLKADESGILSLWFKDLMKILNRDPKRYEVARSRGVGDLREAVVKVAGDQTDLSPVLASVSRDTYLLRFEPVGSGRAIGPVRVAWNPDRLATVTVKGLAPGLYAVRQLDVKGRQPREPSTEAWVLFTGPESFDNIFCEFRDSVVFTVRWPVREGTKRQYLRVALTKLEAEVR
jgi:hypothetical protein